MTKATGKAIINDKRWQEIRERMEKMSTTKGRGVKIGVFQSAGEHDDSGISTVEIAAIHEFGSPAASIPERSFLRAPIRAKKSEISKISKPLLKKIVEGEMDEAEALAILGQWGVKVVRAAITQGEGIPPPLKPETIRRKGSSRPLVDTGRLVNSITYQVEGEAEHGGGSEAGGSEPEVES